MKIREMVKLIDLTFWTLLVLSIAALSGEISGQKSVDRNVSISNVRQMFQTPPNESRIMVRWWWFGPAVTKDEIEREMNAMKEGGIGGFELAVVYPMMLDENLKGTRNEKYMSPEFLEKVRFTSQKALDLGLRMDITIGSGWSYGGPYITPELAAARLRSDSFEITQLETTFTRPTPYKNEKLVGAYVGRGAKKENPNTFQSIDISGTGDLKIPAGSGPRTIVFYYSSKTGQNVKRAAIGAEGYVLDHYNKTAIETHLREVGDKFMAAVVPGSVHSIFCDSLEVYMADWTADFLDEFKKRRGYDLQPLLPLIEYDEGAKSEILRRDFYKTLTELFEDRFLVPMKEWSTKNKVLFRMQNYGNPPTALSSARYIDLVEGEGWQWRTLSATRWASSASHLYGNPITSSETWTWIHSPAFRATPLDIKAEADLHFLSGINQLIGHGWTYSPPEAGNPGIPFYAAGVLSNKNPWYPVMPDVSAYLQRTSYLLRQGEPIADIALYAPTEDAWASFNTTNPRYLNLWYQTGEVTGAKIIPAILDSGHSFDVFDDGTLQETQKRGYKAIILPNVKMMPDKTKQWLADYVRGGGKVISVNRNPEGVSTFEIVSEDNLSSRLSDTLPADVSIKPFASEVGFIHRQLIDADIYFLANTTNIPKSFSAKFNTKFANAEIWNSMSGKSEKLEIKNGEIAFNLEPYGSNIIVFRKDADPAAPLAKSRSVIATENLGSDWNLSFGETAASKTNLPNSWEQNKATQYFSGTATYSKTINLSKDFRSPEARIYLDFGDTKPIKRAEFAEKVTLRGNSFAALVATPIREAATIYINGKRAGSVWATPFKIDITDFIKDGANDIKIEVYNTALNRLAEGGHMPDMKPLVERYGLRTRLQDMDNIQPIPSGILSIPRITAEK